ncbi:MAG: hypothetical protein JXR37_14440 [Kiritimatiellae bacterium]|nr:hypothetical protein [Kiritimatiellia bacterium]
MRDVDAFSEWRGLLLYFVFHGMLIKKLSCALRLAQSRGEIEYEQWALTQLLCVRAIMLVSRVSFSAGIVPSRLLRTCAVSAVILSWHDHNKERSGHVERQPSTNG